MRCKDCGIENYTPSTRLDVCTNCFGLRLEFIQARKRGELSAEQFASVQRTIAKDVFAEGDGARAMRESLTSRARNPAPRRYCPGCGASITSTDVEAGCCTQCRKELRGERGEKLTQKKTCEDCAAIRNAELKCELGYNNRGKVRFGSTFENIRPQEPCPKPRITAEFVQLGRPRSSGGEVSRGAAFTDQIEVERR